MTTIDIGPARTPWHLWAAGVLGVMWNAFGCFDYVMSHTKGDAYFHEAGMSEAQIAYFHGLPAWMTAVWAVGVWGGLLGAVLLLARTRHAAPVFVVSLAAFAVSVVYSLLVGGSGVVTQQVMIMDVAIAAGCLFFIWYAWTMTKRGVLR